MFVMLCKKDKWRKPIVFMMCGSFMETIHTDSWPVHTTRRVWHVKRAEVSYSFNNVLIKYIF